MLDSLAEQDSSNFWEKGQIALGNLGVSSVFYGTILSKKEAERQGLGQSLHYRTSHPHEWLTEMERGNQFDYGLSLQELTAFFPAPLMWHTEYKKGLHTPESKRLFEFEYNLGLAVGATIPLSSFDTSDHLSVIGLAFKGTSEREFAKNWHANQQVIQQICHTLDAGLHTTHSTLLVELSPRENEVLTYLAAGYRPDEIATRWHRSHKTIDKYIQSAKKKLKASTRDHAVAKAIMLNLISP